MTRRFARLRRFRFNFPQRVAAVLLALFFAQGLWIISRQTLTELDYQYARCGRETWENPAAVPGYFTTCGNLHDGVLAYRAAGLPLTLSLLAQRALDLFRAPENRVVQPGGAAARIGTWELRHQLRAILLLMRLPFLCAGCALGGALWWVARRLYGNLGGYTALALYCFSPPILQACASPSPDILAALGVYGALYTCIGVAHAMQGPRRKSRPRIVLLSVLLGIAAAAHIAALPVTLVLGLVFMLWIAEGRRSRILPVLLLTGAAALVLVFACYNFSPDAFSYLFRSSSGFLWLSLDPMRRFFSNFFNCGLTIAASAALVLYGAARRSRYFGNTTPLLCALAFFLLVMTGAPGTPWLWAVPFLLTFVGGVFADAYEGPRGRLALAAAASLVVLQAMVCLIFLSGRGGF